jgi:flagellar biosynthesis/type III secretory pathway protein FliH
MRRLQNMEEARSRRQKIIIMCEPEDVGLVEEGLNKIDYAKAQGTIEITYDPKLPVSALKRD